MLADSNFNPINRLRTSQSKLASPINRAAMLGNDQTGMLVHFDDIAMNTFDELQPAVHRHTTWQYITAIQALRPEGIKISDLVRSNKRDVFWSVYKTLRQNGLTRRQVLLYILQNATT